MNDFDDNHKDEFKDEKDQAPLNNEVGLCQWEKGVVEVSKEI